MGCDIHDYCEIKTDNGWVLLGDVFEDPYNKSKRHEHPYDMRNYCLFGFLAGVRSDKVLPVDLNLRGIPEDCSDEYLAIVETWAGDGHSHNWYTLKELLDYPLYDHHITLEGIVSSYEYKRFKEKGSPDSYSGGVGGYRTYHVSNEEMEEYLADPDQYLKKNIRRLLEENKRSWEKYDSNCPAYKSVLEDIKLVEQGEMPDGIGFYTTIHWQESVRECLGEWWFEKTLERMKELAPDGDYNKIRMVFFFDN
jgi:hypothetical protein